MHHTTDLKLAYCITLPYSYASFIAMNNTVTEVRFCNAARDWSVGTNSLFGWLDN